MWATLSIIPGQKALSGLSSMDQPIHLPCELCGSQAMVAMHSHTDATGKAIEWPKATVKEDGIYFSIDCPQCGNRDQLMAKPGENE
jgi:myo-inositol catabolism protein IolC